MPRLIARSMSVVKDQGSYFVESSNSTDVSYHAVRAYYDIYANLRKQHPDVLLEICNDGGRMVDFGSAAHGDYFSITDTYDPLSNRRAFYDASHFCRRPCSKLMWKNGLRPEIENFRYMLRSGMMGWLTIMLDTNAWTEQQHAAAKEEIQLYKEQLRRLSGTRIFTTSRPGPTGFTGTGLEFFDPKRARASSMRFAAQLKRKQPCL